MMSDFLQRMFCKGQVIRANTGNIFAQLVALQVEKRSRPF